MIKSYRRWRRSGCLAVAAVIVASGAAAPSVAQEGESTGPRLDTIVVSAQKREETAKDVPIAVTAVSGETITDFGLSNFEDVDIPGLVVARGGMADTVSIRGVGSDTNLGFEQSVPTYIDGVYYGRARIQRFAFLDAERIEVLKGPQPTYLGKNAVAGAINITSRRPGDVFAGNVSAFYEFNNNEVGVEGGVDLPITDHVRSRFAFKYRDLNEGWVQNLATGEGEPEIRDILGRGTVEVDLTDTLQMTVQGYIGENLDEGRNNQPFNCQASFFSSGVSDPALETCEIDYVKASLGEIPTAGSNDLFFQGPNGTFLNRLEIYGGNVSFDW
ncbi:MAG: TonB-dependent receptor plug domain-containing protein, partial [Pseudomonadota bacterium]